MQEHFNENYMESDQTSKSRFQRTLYKNIEKIDFNKDGDYPVEVNGDLLISR